MNLELGDIYWIGTGLSLLFTAITLPLWRRVCGRIGLVDDPGARKLHATPVPLAGGLAVLTGCLVAAAAVFTGSASLRELIREHLRMWLAVCGGALLMTLVGVMDDRHVLRPGPKFALQLLVALAIAATGLRITLFVANPVFQYAITAFWFLAVINAFNFMDNMNGLCAGLGAIAAGTFALAANRHAQHAEVMFSLLIAGALLGFLPFNYPRGRVFLGDAGSHLVGYCMAVGAILPSFHTAEDPRPLAVLIPLLVLAIPLLDMARMVVVRTRAGKPFYVGDTNHLSHRFVQLGLTPSQAVALIWALAALCSVLALLL